MPGFDRTGPEGRGCLTGQKRGRCNTSGFNQGFEKRKSIKRQGFSNRLRSCWRWNDDFCQPLSEADELINLQSKSQMLEINLKSINERIEEIKKKSPTKG